MPMGLPRRYNDEVTGWISEYTFDST